MLLFAICPVYPSLPVFISGAHRVFKQTLNRHRYEKSQDDRQKYRPKKSKSIHSIMAREPRSDFYLWIILRYVLPLLIFLVLIVSGIVATRQTLFLSEPVPRPFIIGMAVTISILIVLVIFIALIIRLRKAKNPKRGGKQCQSETSSVAIKLGCPRERHQQKKMRIGPPQPILNGSNAWGPVSFLFNQPNQGPNTRDRSSGQQHGPESNHVRWTELSTPSHSQKEALPRPLTPYPWFVSPSGAPKDGFYPCALFARSVDIVDSPQSDSVTSSLRTGVRNLPFQSQESLPTQQIGLSEKSASRAEKSLRRVNRLEEIRGKYATELDRVGDIDLELGLGEVR